MFLKNKLVINKIYLKKLIIYNDLAQIFKKLKDNLGGELPDDFTSDRNIAVPFSLKRIQEARTSQEFLTFKQSFYINIYIKEKDKYYYIIISKLK